MGKKESAPEVTPEIPAEEGRPLWQAALAAHQASMPLFTCSVIVATTTGGALGFGGKKTTRIERFSPDKLLVAIESIGWRLEQTDHIWIQPDSHLTSATA
jgi:hypothetical protein